MGPGPAGSTGNWTDVLQNARDNTASEVRFAGGEGTTGTDATGTFVLATVQFRAKAASTGTPITFGTDTTVTSGTENVTGDTTGATLRVTCPGCAPPESGDWTIQGSCTLTGDQSAQGKVIVEEGVTLTIDSRASLDIDLSNHNLRIKDGARVVIRDLGRIH